MTDTNTEHPSGTDRADLEIKHLCKQIEKLTLEVEALQTSGWWNRAVGRYLPIVTAILAVAGFWVGLIQYHLQRGDADQERLVAQQQRTIELRREAARPFWETQLGLYVRASEAAATIATTKDAGVRTRAEATFWTLYWGPLSCVEDMTLDNKPKNEVEKAMVAFGEQLTTPNGDVSLSRLSLNLAHAMRDQIAPSFQLSPAVLEEKKTK